MTQDPNSKHQLLESWRGYKSLILDACEQEMGESHRWRYLRSRLLKYLGENGFERLLLQSLAPTDGNEGGSI